MTKPKRITKEDSDLFRKSIGKVHRIKHDGVLFDRPKKSVLRNTNDSISEHVDIFPVNQTTYTLKSNDKLEFKKPGIQNKLLRKLKKGQIAVESELDLHGLTIPTAKKELMDFLTHCYHEQYRCVRIVHGKGKSSDNNFPVLKNNINHWLPQAQEVLAYCSALPSDGGAGAVYVLLKIR